MVLFCRKSLYLAICSTILVKPAYAQNNRIFAWKFAENTVSQSLPTCQTIPITVQPFNVSDPLHPGNSSGVPPYFMLAMASGSATRLYPLGSDPNSLNFTIDYPPSTELLLAVIDSNNTSGGVPGNLFTVVSGQDENCVKPIESNPGFTISANVSNTINTCDPWGITVKGGTPPYRWTLAQVKSPVITNVTGLKDEDELVYIMRGDVGQKLFVAASDSAGQFAHGTPVILPQGSTDVTCIGRNSRTGNSTVFAAQKEASDKAAADAARRKSITVGTSVGAVILVLLGLCAAWIYVRRRRQQRVPIPFTFGKEYGMGQDLTVMPYRTVPARSDSEEELIPHSERVQAAIFTTFPTNPAARKGKTSSPISASERVEQGSPNQASGSGAPIRVQQEDGEIVIQHADAGDLIRELPPPYVDRSGRNEVRQAAPPPTHQKL